MVEDKLLLSLEKRVEEKINQKKAKKNCVFHFYWFFFSQKVSKKLKEKIIKIELIKIDNSCGSMASDHFPLKVTFSTK